MVNKNYIHSYRLENDVVHLIERQGYFCQRGAGSHKIDVVAFPPVQQPSIIESWLNERRPLWISCKYGSAKEKEKEFSDKAASFGCRPLIASRKRGKKLQIVDARNGVRVF